MDLPLHFLAGAYIQKYIRQWYFYLPLAFLSHIFIDKLKIYDSDPFSVGIIIASIVLSAVIMWPLRRYWVGASFAWLCLDWEWVLWHGPWHIRLLAPWIHNILGM